MSKVYFIGAGPGDPDLLTIKGKRIIDSADIIIYAGSLVNKQVLDARRKDSVVHNSAPMTLDEVIAVIEEGISQHKIIARVHTGDPALYGAIREQIVELEKRDIAFEVVPGVSSFTAAAAAIGREFTVPGVSQTVICTRLEGRTPVPEKESLELLASHRASMAIFLSVHMIKNVVEKLTVHYAADTPVAVIQKVSWDDQKIVTGTLASIALDIKKHNISKTAIILVGEFMGSYYELSKLYDNNFSHEYRTAR